jgi:acetyl-CoA acetyltransferase
LEDAQLTPKDIQSVHFGNCLWGYDSGQNGIRGQLAMRGCHITEVPITNLEGACATGSMAFHSAWKDILTGLFDCTLAVGAEKVFMQDKVKMFASFNLGLDVANKEACLANWKELIKDISVKIPDDIEPVMHSPFMDVYGYGALWHMHNFGSTQRQMAVIAAKNHNNGALNPNAQYQFNVSVDEALNDYVVTWPLTRSMCSPVGDGAASAILCSGDYLKRLPDDVQKRAIKIRASVMVSYRDNDVSDISKTNRIGGTSARAAKLAYEFAGVGPEDINLAECHDASAAGEMAQYENLGFCPAGEGGLFAESGATQIGGKIPVNTSGGLISRGHPLAASGLAMLHEVVTQLRGEAGARQVAGARMGLTENGGGSVAFDDAACVVNILEAV